MSVAPPGRNWTILLAHESSQALAPESFSGANGCVRVDCADCTNGKLVALSFKGLRFCPSRTAMHTNDRSAHLVDICCP